MRHPSQPPLTTGTLRAATSRRRPDQGYYLYVPRGFEARPGARLLVTVHGHDREAVSRAEHFVPFAEDHQYVLLSPRFAPSIRYQVLGVGGERADLRLLDLVDEVAGDLGIDADRFDLVGYSGGAQFAHRFLYAWPRRLRSVVVGAPGTVTLPNDRERWPVGVRGLARVVGARFNLEDVRGARLLLIVGTDDVLLEGLNQSLWAMRAGATRLNRARSLHAAWLVAGIGHTYVELPGAGHGVDEQFVREACEFMAACR
jgi:pimeloyl-ACP methyl ester carboxylesterase